MHICFVSREYPPNLMGGIGTYVVNMTRILAEAGHTISVLTQAHPEAPTEGYENPHAEVDGRLRVYYLPFVTPDWQLREGIFRRETDALMRRDLIAGFSWVVAEALEQLLIDEAVDVIEAPEYEAPLAVFQQRRSTLAKGHPFRLVPTVVHLHSPSHMIFQHNDDLLSGKWVRARKTNEALSICLADAVLSPSQFLAGQVREWLSLEESRITIIPYPIGPLIKYDEGVRPVPGRCLFVGRVEPRKGVFEFVEAAVSAARRHPNLSFRFVGGPHLRGGSTTGQETAELIRSLIPESLRNRFDFAGRVPRETLGAEYRQAAFVAVPSRWDNFPNTCMEAMSCGRPVLASDQGGMAEMLTGTEMGYLAPGPSRAQLVRELEKGLDFFAAQGTDALDTMGEAARRRILDFCDDAAIARRHIEYYQSCQQSVEQREAKPAKSLSVGVLLATAQQEVAAIEASLSSIAGQEVEASSRVLVSDEDALPGALHEALRGWIVIADRGEASPGSGGLPQRLKSAFSPPPDILYIGATGDVLHPTSFLKARRFFANHPEAGFCSSWIEKDGAISAAVRDEPDHLLSPAAFPERWFFRMRAITEAGGIFANGYFLTDLLRDLVLRIIEKGWRGSIIPEPLVRVGEDSPEPVVRPFGFHERRDSLRDVALAHLGSRRLPSVYLSEQLGNSVD